MSKFFKVQDKLVEVYREQSINHMKNIGKVEMAVINEVCTITGVSKYVIFAKRRHDEIVQARNMVIYRMKQLWGGSLNHYARMMWLDKADHTSVMNALQTFRDDFETDADYRAKYELLCKKTINLRPELPIVPKKISEQKTKIDIPLNTENTKISSISIGITLENGTKLEIELKNGNIPSTTGS